MLLFLYDNNQKFTYKRTAKLYSEDYTPKHLNKSPGIKSSSTKGGLFVWKIFVDEQYIYFSS